MAQIREFESTTESYFILDGVSYPKVYEAMLDNGYSDTKIKLVGTNRDTTPLVFSTEYTNILVDGEDFDTALEAISRLNQVVFSKGGGSGGGGTTGDYIPLSGTEKDKEVYGIVGFKNSDTPGNIIEVSSDKFNFESVTNDSTKIVQIRSDDTRSAIYSTFSKTIDGNTYQHAIDINTILGTQMLGIVSNIDHTEAFVDDVLYKNENIYAQRSYSNKQNSYFTTEQKTGGKWIDDKDIYTITQLTADTPPTMETVFPTEVIGTYTVYKYTKP